MNQLLELFFHRLPICFSPATDATDAFNIRAVIK